MEERCPLDDVLDMLRVRGAVMAHLRAHAPWGIRLARAPGATFHAVTAGSCWIRVPGESPRELLAGDVVLLPAGVAHTIASDASGPAKAWDRVAKARARNAAGEICLDGPGGSAHVICAAYDYDRDVAHPLLSLLPPTLFISGQHGSGTGAVQRTVRMLRQELSGRAAGRGTIIDRLIDVLFVYVIRDWIMARHEHGTSWLSALHDPVLGRALTIMHSAPSVPWTVETLAREVSLSRATLTRRFTALVGEPPLSYLTRWRMDLAARELRETEDAVSAIARRVGYTSEFAFSRAFSRAQGNPPGRYRAEVKGRRRQQQTRAGR
ncbi:MAG: AraC family transcriptional regulator [bacterium]